MSYSLILGFSFCCLILSIGNCSRIRFDNYKVYKVFPQNQQNYQILQDLEVSSDSLIFLNGISLYTNSSDVVVAPHKQNEFINILDENNIQYMLIDDNIQDELDAESFAMSRRSSQDYDWTSYHTLEETYAWLDGLAQKYPNNVEIFVAGTTYEKREIRCVKVSHKPGNKAVFIEAGIHAREWIAPATATYILNELLTSNDTQVRNLAENFDFYIIPHTNPDGFVYTHESDRLWRKTRSRNGLCRGTDPNRNFDFHWNEVGASSYPCSETYAGRYGFSEVETRTTANFIYSIKDHVKAYISFHSFSQLILFPYGYTSKKAPNHNDLQKIGDYAANALSKRYGTRYTVGNVYNTIYPASGASFEWVYGKADVKLAFTYELRPASGGGLGFVLPPEQIIPTSEETLDSLLALIEKSEELKYFS